MSDLRPIALCKVLYKIIAKALANRLKTVLPSIISENQSAFIPNRTITDNILIAYEMVHFLKRERYGKTGYAALKIDISKAYDRMEWSFLSRMMQKMGFASRWISLMEICVQTVSYKISSGGEFLDPIKPTIGLRQGDPPSPYLFLICAEGLSDLIQQKERQGLIHGCKIAKHAPLVSHLFFTDDSLLLFRANERESSQMKMVLNT